MDTFKDRQQLEEIYARGNAPVGGLEQREPRGRVRRRRRLVAAARAAASTRHARPERFGDERPTLRVLCLGAHADDIEIGCGGLILHASQASPKVDVDWVVFSARRRARARGAPQRRRCFSKAPRARASSSNSFGMASSRTRQPDQAGLRDAEDEPSPDLVLTHYRRRSPSGSSRALGSDLEHFP